jgi:hypothetical protein
MLKILKVVVKKNYKKIIEKDVDYKTEILYLNNRLIKRIKSSLNKTNEKDKLKL